MRASWDGPARRTELSSAAEESWTIGRLLEWTTGFFRDRRIDSPRLDAEVLLAHVLSCKRIDLYVMFDAEVLVPDRSRYRDLVRRRATGMPVAYLVGEREFYSLPFEVNPAVLIPRPETETLVDAALERIPADRPTRVADVGTGSGAIAIAIAFHRPLARVTAVDLSAEALVVARRNADRHHVADRIEWVHSDLFRSVDAHERFEVIASNPPYVSRTEMNALPVDVRNFEPRLALEAGEQGLDVIHPLVSGAADRLDAGGWLLVEMGETQSREVAAFAQGCSRYDQIGVIKDLSHRPRVLIARLRS